MFRKLDSEALLRGVLIAGAIAVLAYASLSGPYKARHVVGQDANGNNVWSGGVYGKEKPTSADRSRF
jgi:hypothetical protein